MARTDPNALLILYKYRSLTEPFGRQTAEDVIIHNRLWWQSPLAFNDPFDCNPALIFGFNDADRRKFARRAALNQFSHLPRHMRKAKQRELLAMPIAQREGDMRQAFSEWMAESAVTCFSMVGNHPLMWAHYADSHRGGCFVFRECLEEQWIAHEVEYAGERPRPNITSLEDGTFLKQSVLTKAAEWSYEQEARMFDYKIKPGYRSFPPLSLIGVVYGARISNDDRDYVRGLVCRRAGSRVRQYQASIHDRLFALNIAGLD